MSTALLDYSASHNFIALTQPRQFAPNYKDWWWAKPLQVKFAEKTSIISSQISKTFMQFACRTIPKAVEFHVVTKLKHPVILGISWFAEFSPQID